MSRIMAKGLLVNKRMKRDTDVAEREEAPATRSSCSRRPNGRACIKNIENSSCTTSNLTQESVETSELHTAGQ